MGWFIVAAEIGFWVFVIAGLVARYMFRMPRLGAFLLICTPIVDLILLAVTVIDLRNGAAATSLHGLAAVYIGVSVVYGHSMIRWADNQFAYRFLDKPKPVKEKKYGREHAKVERTGWYRHLFAWMIGAALLLAIILYIDNAKRTEVLMGILRTWTLVLVVDFLISFSYSIFPRKARES